jgi:two-component system, cell cycle sensor histidine kinase and response regulator CckA
MKRSALSFKIRLRLLVLLAAAGPLLVAAGVLLVHERRVLHRLAESEAASVARLIGANTAAALTFGDAAAARENLSSLSAMPELLGGAVYDASGRRFAAWGRAPEELEHLPAAAPQVGGRVDGAVLMMATPLLVDGERLGTVVLRFDTSDVAQRVREHAVTLVLVLLASALAVLLVAARVQRSLARPIERLGEAARRVSGMKDYSVRVPVTAADELGSLTIAFNEMLERVQERDTASQDMLRDILEHSTNLFYSHGPDHVLTFVSPQTRSYLDCEPEEALTRWNEFASDNPINREGHERTLRALATGQRQPSYELELRSRTGRMVWVEVSEAPVVRDGHVVAIVGALTDITDRKRAEEEKARLEMQFRQSQKMEAVGRLAGGVAHDFNNLLGVILGYAELLRRALTPGGKEERRVQEIMKAADRAAALTRQLLAFSRKQVLDPRPLDLAEVVTEIEDMLRRLIREDIRLDLSVDEGVWTVRADRTQVEQVVLNLAVNARDAMPDGGSLSLSLANVTVGEGGLPAHLGLAPGQWVRLSVSDTGTGMDAATLSHVFEPFFTTKAKGAGTGLGLATVYGVVQQSGGVIDVASAPNQGSTFTVYLPAISGGAAATLRASTPPLAHGAGTILLVEDEDALRRLGREVLEAQGYSVLDAASGTEALCLLAEHPGRLDLLVTDVIMPGMSGRALAEQVLRDRPGTPLLYMSGYTDDVLSPHGLPDNGTLLLEKPFSPEALVRKVQETIAYAAQPA